MIARAVRVTGRVQKVGYRWHTWRRAGSLGVTGWVRNETDGSVVAHIEGEPAAVQALLDWMQRGPATASVTGVHWSDAMPIHAESFEIV